MRLISNFAALALGILCLASCDAAISNCATPAAGAANVLADGSGCQSLMCTGDTLDCNGSAADGCETNISADVSNCGSCGYKCPTPAVGEATCIDGSCGVTTCGSRYKDCNGNTADSCEADTFRDASNCGGCGTVCGGGSNAVGVCVQGKCQLSCQGLYLDCNGDASDGCETNGASDLGNCGNCGNVCTKVGATTPACSAGSCGSTMCTGSNRTCKAGPADGCETDTAVSAGNCGTCGKVCPAVANGTPGCAASNCGIGSCNANFDSCDGNVANGCETNITTSIAHCSGCGKACPTYANASAKCAASVCGLGMCNTGFANCDMADANGCEINTNTDKNNCGTCGKVCPGVQFCSAGTCISDPCINYGGTKVTVNANIKICNNNIAWGSWNPAMIPAPWQVCTLAQWMSYAPAVLGTTLGLPNSTTSWLWINGPSCGAGSHREIASTVFNLNDANCYNGPNCCYPDSSLFLIAVCSP